MDLISYNNNNSNNNNGNERSEKLLPPLGMNRKSTTNEPSTQYTLANSAIAHRIPPKNALRSSGEIQLGVIDTWPAHSANQRPSNVQLSLTKNNSLLITNAQLEGKTDMTPKPKFLENLEKFLQRELKILGCHNSTTTSEARLQAYREAFEYLLEEFKTYKPILASIKNEYEMMLAAQREKIRELEPLKQMLVTLADQCDHKLMQYREEDNLEIRELKEEKKRLLDLVSALKNEKHALNIQVEKLQSELVIEHEKYRNENDKRKLLISDLNDLRFQQEEARLAELKREKKVQEDGAPAEDTSNDDPVTLKIALRVCRQNLNDAMKRLTIMEAEYGDVIPRRDYQALETVFNETRNKLENLDNEHKSILEKYNRIKDYAKDLEKTLLETQHDLEQTRANNTPRPDWDRYDKYLDGGSEKMKDLTLNKSTIKIIDCLLPEISGVSKKDFVGLGSGSDVPVYLRHDGKVKNRNLSRREICSVINAMLKERSTTTKENLSSSSSEHDDMGEFMLDYLKKKHGNEAIEYSYSINDGFNKYSHDLIKFFQGIVNQEIDENVYHHERKCISILTDQLKEADAKDSSNGTVTKNVLRDILRHFFRYKNSEQISNLVKIAEEDSSSSAETTRIDYKFLLNEESEEKITNFLTTFKAYIRDERLVLAQHIKDNLSNINIVTPADLKKAINTADETLSDKKVEKINAWCFNGDKQLDLDALKRRLDNVCLYNYPKK